MATSKVNISGMLSKLDLTVETVRQEATVLLRQASEIGRDASRDALNLAITPYGAKRYAAGRGGSAGRNDTGSMIEDLQAGNVDIKNDELVVKFGWGRGRSKKYYKFQEEGTAKIRAANSLLAGRQEVISQLPRLERNMKARIKRKIT